MVALKRGVIVNLSSRWGRGIRAGLAPYCASKWAIEGLTQALAQDLPSGMATVSLNPGLVDTCMLRGSFPGTKAILAAEWARQVVPFLLGIGPEHNGRSLEGRTQAARSGPRPLRLRVLPQKTVARPQSPVRGASAARMLFVDFSSESHAFARGHDVSGLKTAAHPAGIRQA